MVVIKTSFYLYLGAKDKNTNFLKLNILGKFQGDGRGWRKAALKNCGGGNYKTHSSNLHPHILFCCFRCLVTALTHPLIISSSSSSHCLHTSCQPLTVPFLIWCKIKERVCYYTILHKFLKPCHTLIMKKDKFKVRYKNVKGQSGVAEDLDTMFLTLR